MKNRTQTLIIIAILTLIFVACQSDEPQVTEVTHVVTNTVTETVEVAGAPVEVTRVVEATVVETVVVEPYTDATTEQEAPAAVAAEPLPPASGVTQPRPEDSIAPMPTAAATAPAAAPNAMFFEQYGVNPYILTNVDNLSTFSLDVDTGSYNVAKRYLQDGLMPPPQAVRVEEFVNSFDQGYENPPDVAFAIYADGAPSPFHNDGTYFLRIGVQGYDVPEAERPSANLVFVIDVSGSMAQENRLGLVKESLALLVDRLRADDKVSIVVYGNSARTVLYPTAGSERQAILNAINTLETEGSTNLEAGLLMGYDVANQGYIPGGINRVILASDGVANVGDTGPNSLAAKIRGYADAGINLTTIGVGLGNYNDVMMEQLADQGDGAYAYVDNLNEARQVFGEDVMGTLQTIGLDAKIQVEFDPQVVQQYRLVGYENRAIADQDFRNNEVDAAEFGAGHTAVAVYAVQLTPGAQGRVATVYLRWQDPQTRAVQEINGVFNTDNLAASFDAAPLHYQLAITVSQWAELLRHSYWTEGVNMDDVRIRTERLASQMDDTAVTELAQLVELSR
ncbi:MAG: von Willebrand factor type A domain-containing protein [Anaerolineae bacterium]|nr:von Willebrand factor type A domain-containing protein [Anaerolineae bacterium]